MHLSKLTLKTALPWLLIIGGVLGVVCSLILMVEKIDVLTNSAYKPICDLDPILNCKSVMTTTQSKAFGFDNTLLGLSWFAAVATTGLVLAAGAKLKRWYWLGFELAMAASFAFIVWLIYSILYVIHSLCPFCMVVWVVTITMFWYLSLYVIEAKYVRLKGVWLSIATFARRHHLDFLLSFFLVILLLILKEFWYYYGPKLGF